MKKIISLLTLSLLMLSTASAQDDTTVDAYFTTKDMPDMLQFLPGPPENDSPGYDPHGVRAGLRYEDH